MPVIHLFTLTGLALGGVPQVVPGAIRAMSSISAAVAESFAAHVKPGERILDPLEEGEAVMSLADEAVVEAEAVEIPAEGEPGTSDKAAE